MLKIGLVAHGESYKDKLHLCWFIVISLDETNFFPFCSFLMLFVILDQCLLVIYNLLSCMIKKENLLEFDGQTLTFQSKLMEQRFLLLMQ